MRRAAAVGAVATAGCVELPALTPEFDVGMSANAFQPETISVAAGESVIWYNDGSRSHTVTAYAEALPAEATFFASGDFDDERTARDAWNREGGGNIAPGQRYSHTFQVPGRHPYFCVPHESDGMVGDVVVTD